METRLMSLTWLSLLATQLLVACAHSSERQGNTAEDRSLERAVAIQPVQPDTLINGQDSLEKTNAPKDSIPWLVPEIVDHFLYEDKYYMKLRFPEHLPGTLSLSLMENNHFSATALDSTTYQLIVYDALDLAFATLVIDYLPAAVDTHQAARQLIFHRTNFYTGN